MRNILLAAVAALATPLSAAQASAPEATVQPAEVRLPHISITTVGQGPAVVLIPGLSSPHAVWDGAAAELARSNRLILVQINGYAGDAPGANLKPGILAGIGEDLHAYLKREKLGPIHLVGHSMGGLAGLLFAQAHPEDVRAMMVVDALPFFPVLMDPNITVEQAQPIAKMMRDRVAATFDKPLDPATVEANVRSLALKPASLERMKAWAGAADPRVTAQALYEDMTTDARPLLGEIRAPVTLVVPWSEAAFGKDRTIAFYRKQYAGAAGIALVDIGEAGHFVMLDQPEAFRAALRDFVGK